ncbi:MAG: hypothetical protein M3460_30610 [Actinomycetota bacterium]|nr:hypothetical protein [Actinomycetota bacterium]
MRKIPTRGQLKVVTTLAIINIALCVGAIATSIVNELDEAGRHSFFSSAAFGVLTLLGAARGYWTRSRFINESIYEAWHVEDAVHTWRRDESAINLSRLIDNLKLIVRRRDVLAASGEFHIAHEIDRVIRVSIDAGLATERRRWDEAR